jgi:hypothetical protein
MPELPVIGQIKDPDELDLEPIIVPLAAYKQEKGKTVEEIGRFPFKPMMPAGARALMESSLGQNGEIPYSTALVILNRCIVSDSVERWGEFLDRDDLSIEQDALGSVLSALYEVYSGRPTRRPSGSDGTGQRRARTSRAAPRSTE